MGPMTITDPTALHSPKRSIVSKATQWTIDTLAPLREHLSVTRSPNAGADQLDGAFEFVTAIALPISS
jgi:hypothetical protein